MHIAEGELNLSVSEADALSFVLLFGERNRALREELATTSIGALESAVSDGFEQQPELHEEHADLTAELQAVKVRQKNMPFVYQAILLSHIDRIFLDEQSELSADDLIFSIPASVDRLRILQRALREQIGQNLEDMIDPQELYEICVDTEVELTVLDPDDVAKTPVAAEEELELVLEREQAENTQFTVFLRIIEEALAAS